MYSQAQSEKINCIEEKMTRIYGDKIGLLGSLIESLLSTNESLQNKQIIMNYNGQIYRLNPSLKKLENNRGYKKYNYWLLCTKFS